MKKIILSMIVFSGLLHADPCECLIDGRYVTEIIKEKKYSKCLWGWSPGDIYGEAPPCYQNNTYYVEYEISKRYLSGPSSRPCADIDVYYHHCETCKNPQSEEEPLPPPCENWLLVEKKDCRDSGGSPFNSLDDPKKVKTLSWSTGCCINRSYYRKCEEGEKLDAGGICILDPNYSPPTCDLCKQPNTNFTKPADNQQVAFTWKSPEDRTAECTAIPNSEKQQRKVNCEDEFRCLVQSCKVEKDEQVSSYVSPRDGTFHEDIEVTGADFGLHYDSSEWNSTSIAHGWSISSHAKLVDGKLYLGSGTLYAYSQSTQKNALTIVTYGSNEYLFDVDGKLQSTRDLYTKETKTTFGYDNMGRLVTVTDIYGQISIIERDSNGIATAIVAPTGQRTLLSIDNNGDLLEIHYEDTSSYVFEYERHLMTKETEPNGNAFLHFFDEDGKVIKVIDAEQGEWIFGSASENTFDTHRVQRASGDVVTYKKHLLENGILKSEKTLPTGDVVLYENAVDESNSSTTSCGMKTTNIYKKENGTLYKDPYTNRRVLESFTVSTPSGLSKVTHYNKAYATSNGKVNSISSTTETNNKLFTNLREYAAFKAFSTTAENKTSRIVYDSLNQNIQSIKPYGLLETKYVYDTKGRVIEERTGERVSTYVYDDKGRRESSIDPLLQTTSYTYDSRDRLTSTTYADGHTIYYSYDANGNMTQLTTPTPSDHTFAYNGVNKRTSYDSPLGKNTTYSYDKQRRLTSITKPSGASIDYTYTNGRLTSVVTPDGTTGYSYGCQSNLSSITRDSESFSYTYDGTLLTSMIQHGILEQTIDFSYNNDFLVSSMTYAGKTTHYTYDKDNKLTQSGDFSINRTLNNTLSKTLTDGTYTQKTVFNGYGEIASQANALFRYTLQRNTSGQIVQKSQSTLHSDSIHSYTYDERGRLKQVQSTESTVYEDSEDQTTNKWEIYDNKPTGATVENVYDSDKQSYVIKLSGTARKNGFILGKWSGEKAWKSPNTSIEWSINFSENFYVYIVADTTKGRRYLYYSSANSDRGMQKSGRSIHHGLGSESKDGTWHTYTRNLQADLQEFEPDNSIVKVNGFMVRGSGKVDDIKLLANAQVVEAYTYDSNSNRATATVHGVETTASYTLDDQLEVYGQNTYRYNEDGYLEEKVTPTETSTYKYGTLGELTQVDIHTSPIAKWEIYDNKPAGASVTNVYDDEKQSDVIEFSGTARKNGFVLGKWNGDKAWRSTDHRIRWSMKFNENFYIYIVVDTKKGRRYLYYSSANTDRGMQKSGRSIHHGLGSESKDGSWHTITRDLQADLQAFEPDNELLSVNGFLVRGSGRIDDIGTPGYYNSIYNIKEDAEIKKKTIKYYQNALNQRVAKMVNGQVVEKYLWKDLTTLLAIYDKDDNLKQRFEYADQRMPISMTSNGQKYYLHYDQVGSLRAITDTSHNIVKEIVYDTYGNILSDSNPSFTIPFGFAGGLYDVDTKLTRFGYRDYDAYTGKWTAKDPIGFSGGDSNLYGYVLGDPVNFVDPMGLFWILFLGGAGDIYFGVPWITHTRYSYNIQIECENIIADLDIDIICDGCIDSQDCEDRLDEKVLQIRNSCQALIDKHRYDTIHAGG